MAILWAKSEGETRYEVRRAGGSLRLYTNGVFHSQFNPNQPVTGSVWDLLLLPGFLVPIGNIRRVLVLGVGGGAVIRQLEHFLKPVQVVGVEINPVHIEVAEKFFGLADSGVELHHADAADWVRRFRGERFDMIIDDLYGEEHGEPVRGVAADTSWARQLLKRLNPGGVLVSNFISSRELHDSAYLSDAKIKDRFISAFRLTTPLYNNVVGAFLRAHSSSRFLRQQLQAFPQLDPARRGCRLRYNIRKLI